MSDIPPHHSIFKWKLCIEEPSLAYAAKNNAMKALFAVGIPYPLLKLWQEYIVNQKEKQNLATAENDNPCPSQCCLDYVDLFELSIPGDVFGITKDRIIRNEVNTSLEKFAEMVKGGRKRKELDSKVRRFQIFEEMVISVKELQRENENICDDLEKAKIALWFMESFGLELTELKAVEQQTGIVHCLSIDDTNPTDNRKGFDSLSSQDQKTIEQVLFLLDKFCIGDSFYHELTMIIDGLPKSYLVKQTTPGNADGAQISFTDMLKAHVEEFVKLHDEVDWSKGKIQIKLSGDGARMTRNSSFILLSFSLFQSQDDVMSASENHTFAIVKGSESYKTLKDSFGLIFQQINNLIQVRAITINNSKLNLEFFLEGDYKFLLLMLGMKSATSNFAKSTKNSDGLWTKTYSIIALAPSNARYNKLLTWQKRMATIRLCGVSFDIWEKKTEDGKASGQYDFTSLLGADKKNLLAELPDKLADCLMPGSGLFGDKEPWCPTLINDGYVEAVKGEIEDEQINRCDEIIIISNYPTKNDEHMVSNGSK
ncbi:Hypothetical predicted protein [Paramuricea clavata]|uniref:Uncharacterized protein n=1 Tax=Paramuricea clavata TaxID=317549 RepID=A0A7D9DII9_PARCT|nr:Hypothetical predicted protein [Paramuricea clavata]